MKLYHDPVSTTSRPVLQFAAEQGLALELQVVDLMQGEHLTPAYSRINPNLAVPVLEDGALRLAEASAILKYLAERCGSPAYPADPRQRAVVNSRMDWFNTQLSRELCYGLVYPQLFPGYKRPDEAAQRAALAWGREKALHWLKVLDEHLIGPYQEYVCGDAVTLADYLGVEMFTLGEAIGLDYGRFRNISRWLANMRARPHWDAVHAPFYDHVVEPLRGLAFERF